MITRDDAPPFWYGPIPRRPQPASPRTNPVWSYSRVSTSEQEDDIEEHMRFNRRFCDLQRWRIDREFQDVGESGREGDCPEMLRLVGEVGRLPAKTRPSRVVIYRLDRAARNLGYQQKIFDWLKYFGVTVVIASDPGLDVTTANGALVANVQGATHQHFSDSLSERMRPAVKRSYREGKWPRRPPFPYSAGGSRRKEDEGIAYLDPDNVQVSLMREVPSRVGREAPEAVLRDLKARGLTVSSSQFYALLRHPFLSGRTFLDDDGNAILDARRAPATIVEGRWEALWSPEEQERLVNLIDTANRSVPHLPRRDDLPLRGLLVCDGCGKRLTAQTVKNGRFRYYLGQPKARRKCSTCGKSHPVVATDLAVAGLLCRTVVTLDGIDWSSQLRALLRDATAADRETITRLDADLRVKEQAAERLTDALTKAVGEAARRRLEARLTAADRDLDATRARRDELAERVRRADTSDLDDLIAYVRDWLANARRWEALSVSERRALISLLFPRGIPVSREGVQTPVSSSLSALLPPQEGTQAGLASPAGMEHRVNGPMGTSPAGTAHRDNALILASPPGCLERDDDILLSGEMRRAAA